MRIFSDFKLFERPPKPGQSLFRYIAWRWLAFGTLFIVFTAFFAAMHYVGGEPIYYTNEHRNMTDHEVGESLVLFFAGGALFAILGLIGVLVIPKS